MNKLNNNDSSPEEKLASLPRDYTFEMAYKNKDVISTNELTYNAEILHRFINNFNNKIIDSVVLTTFGVDGPPTIAILEYDGNIIKLIMDATRFNNIKNYYYFTGNKIIPNIINNDGKLQINYILEKNFDERPITFFTEVLFYIPS